MTKKQRSLIIRIVATVAIVVYMILLNFKVLGDPLNTVVLVAIIVCFWIAMAVSAKNP